MKRTILHVLEIHASPDVVFNAIATIKGLGNWWTTDATGSTAKAGIIHFRFADVFRPDMTVIESTPVLLEWKCTTGEAYWAGDRFTFVLTNAGNNVKLTFTQEYANDISDEDYGRFNFNWGYYLNSLKLFCETGKGTPFSVKK